MSAPVKHTCPDIDRIIKLIRNAINEAEQGRKLDDMEDVESTFKAIVYELSDIEYDLERLCDANHALRNWGDELEAEVSKLECEIEELNNSI